MMVLIVRKVDTNVKLINDYSFDLPGNVMTPGRQDLFYVGGCIHGMMHEDVKLMI